MGTVAVLTLCLLAFVFLMLISGLKIVRQQTAVVVETLGKYNRTLGPGINYVVPILQRSAHTAYLYSQNLEFSIVAITSDKVTITLDTTLIYHVMPDKVAASFYALGNPVAVMKSTLENSIRSYVAQQTHEEILQKRDELTNYLVEHLTEKFEKWGRVIEAFQIKDVILPKEITDAMSKVIASKRLQEAAEFEANANKILKVRAAEADKESRILSGQGVAGEREAIVNGLKESIQNMKAVTGGEVDSVMNVVMLTQYLDTLKSVGSAENSKVVFLNSNPGSIDDMVKQIFGLIHSSDEK
jgi:regulator of protease activity HflC (stomatin/prohibitin superfamily)